MIPQPDYPITSHNMMAAKRSSRDALSRLLTSRTLCIAHFNPHPSCPTHVYKYEYTHTHINLPHLSDAHLQSSEHRLQLPWM